MSAVLVIQLARLGDLLQTRRLILSLRRHGRTGAPAKVHLLVDHSLAGFARLAYPGVVVHGLPAHKGTLGPNEAAESCRRALEGLGGGDFEAVYNINHSPLSLALSAFFDPDQVVGHRLARGQARMDAWAALAMRLMRRRAESSLNLMDYWAGFAPFLADPREVHPEAAPRGGGLAVAVAGRQARRSLPPEPLARIVAVMAARIEGPISLLGTRAESAGARAMAKNLPPALLDRTVDLTGRTGLGDLWELVSGLDALLTPDTGLMHLAAAVGAPVTALFLSSAWCHETGPYGLGHVVWQAGPECAPCLESSPCPHGVRCLEVVSGPELLRLIAAQDRPERLGRLPVPTGLTGFRCGLDGLGAVCLPMAGNDPLAPRRASTRALVGRYLSPRLPYALAEGTPGLPGGPIDARAAAEWLQETDFMLPGRQARAGQPAGAGEGEPA